MRAMVEDKPQFEVFSKHIDARWVEEALEATGTATLRRRRLPAEQVIWLVLGMALFRNRSMKEVVRSLDLALPSVSGADPAASAIVQARNKLGDEPMEWLFKRSADKWSNDSADRHRWRGLAVYGLDGTTVRVPDSDANRAHFGGQNAGAGRGDSGYPLVRLVTLMVLRTHVLAGAAFGPYDSELRYAAQLWSRLPDDALVVVDRGFLSSGLLVPLTRTALNRHWLTRARSTSQWRVLKRLGAREDLVEMDVTPEARRRDPSLGATWTARAIRYSRPGFPPQTLLTSLLDPKTHPAAEIVAIYHERWELELGFDEVKTEMLEREEAIRSKSPKGVAQELWGLALAYNLIRLEMEHVAQQADVPPRRISFVAALELIRTELAALSFCDSPGTIPKRLQDLRSRIAHFILPPRRSERAFPRAVKIKMSNYPRKRPSTSRGTAK
jgi:hypothetical protein